MFGRIGRWFRFANGKIPLGSVVMTSGVVLGIFAAKQFSLYSKHPLAGEIDHYVPHVKALEPYIILAKIPFITFQRKAAHGIAKFSETQEISKESWTELSPILSTLHESKDENVRLNICIALSNLSRQDEWLKKEISEGKWITKTASALPKYTHENSIVFRNYLNKLIYHLSQSEDPQVLSGIIDQGAVTLLSNFVTLDSAAQAQMMLSVQNLSKKGFCTPVFDEFPPLFYSLSKAPNLNASNKVELAKTIAELASHDELRRKIVLLEGFVDQIRSWSEVVAADKNSRQLRLQTAILVGNLAENSEVLMLLARNLGIEYLISLGNVADLDIQSAVEKAILNFQKVEQIKADWKSVDLRRVDDEFFVQ